MYGSSATAGAQFDYIHDNEESNFQLVDSSKPQKPQKNFRRQFVLVLYLFTIIDILKGYLQWFSGGNKEPQGNLLCDFFTSNSIF